jgi:hypothetical protein
MNPFELHTKVWRLITHTISDMRKQAPGARMVGEFAVKQASKEASKKISLFTQTQDSANQSDS